MSTTAAVKDGVQTGLVIQDSPYTIEETDTGVRCGNHGKVGVAFHTSAAAVRACYALGRELDAQAAAEHAAELAVERALEDRGYWDARAQEDYEASHGVVQFDEAYRMACPWLFN